MDCHALKALALDLAKRASTLQLKKFRRRLDLRWKSETDPVTEVDQDCEALIIKGIRKAYPKHAILGEESGSHPVEGAEYLWIIDPLDGTVNYSHGLPAFAVSIGLYERGQALIGVVAAPALGEVFVAERGKGAFVNGKRLAVSKSREPLKSVLASGFAYQARLNGENIREWSAAVRHFQAIRRMGSAALDLCFTAAGRFDAFWEYGLKPWDVAAGGLLLEEAGGKITNLQGKPYDMYKPGILASNGLLHPKLLRVLNDALKTSLRWPPR